MRGVIVLGKLRRDDEMFTSYNAARHVLF